MKRGVLVLLAAAVRLAASRSAAEVLRDPDGYALAIPAEEDLR